MCVHNLISSESSEVCNTRITSNLLWLCLTHPPHLLRFKLFGLVLAIRVSWDSNFESQLTTSIVRKAATQRSSTWMQSPFKWVLLLAYLARLEWTKLIIYSDVVDCSKLGCWRSSRNLWWNQRSGVSNQSGNPPMLVVRVRHPTAQRASIVYSLKCYRGRPLITSRPGMDGVAGEIEANIGLM